MVTSLFNRIRTRIQDIQTLKQLCERAENQAHACGDPLPGAEHFLLAAIDLPDGTAESLFQSFEITQQDIKNAIEKQYSDSLQGIGYIPTVPSTPSSSEYHYPKPTLFESQPSAQQMMQNLSAFKRHSSSSSPLVSIDVVQILLEQQHGVVSRTLKQLNIDPGKLRQEIEHIREKHYFQA